MNQALYAHMNNKRKMKKKSLSYKSHGGKLFDIGSGSGFLE
jgi:hypothetical protein